MTSLQVISHEERLAEPRGFHALIMGPFGIGKTSLLRTLPDPSTALFIDIENGDLAIHDVAVSHVRPQTWPEIRDLIVRIAGPNRSFGPNEPYSQAHFDRVGGFLPGIEGCRTVFFDTLTAAGQLYFRHAAAQPEAISERTGKPDLPTNRPAQHKAETHNAAPPQCHRERAPACARLGMT